MIRHLRTGLLTASILVLSAGAAFADYELNILHINDLHSRIEAINKYDSTCSAEENGKNECFGGIARVKSAIDAARKQIADAGGNVIVLDAGDQFQGSLFYTQYKSAPVAEFMNGIGFDAMAIGNHEFDNGPEELAKFIDALKFPLISGNTVAALNTPVANKFKGYVVKDLGGQKVAIVSVLATDTDETSSPGPNIFFDDEIAYLKTAVKEITDQGVNKIVLLSHVGYERDKQIAAAVDGIDVIVGGHSHTLLSNTDDKAAGPYPTMIKDPAGVDVPVVTAYAYSKYLGELKLVFDDAGKVKSAAGAPKLLDASITPDAGMEARVKELAAPLEAVRAKEISETTEVIDGSREVCRAAECSMGNLVADAMLDHVKDQGITIAIQNGGGLRASIDQGVVTMGEVLTVLPFQNSVATFQLKGADIVTALENGLSEIEEAAGRFPQVSGLKYTFDKSKPAGSRVVSVETKEGETFVPLDPEKLYGVVTNNYMRGGGDGYSIFATAGQNAYDFGPSLEDTVAQYLTENRPYKPVTEGRITEIAAATASAPSTQTSTDTAEKSVTPDAKPAEGADTSAAATTTQQTTTQETTTPQTTTTQTPVAETTPAAEMPSTAKHVVVRGDTLWDLAKSVYGDGDLWGRIAQASGNPVPEKLEIGTELTIPAK
ncbi:5'-nucleotidase C-terminal domain-containing protein [Pararhizobium antarcticum]|uniref:Multifunctional 2',3'-cyclic-nucleotide 2'-phosphodiesterase/5'-nucleotidase/3'-nucleotidase n=1 Tax=Pararhizobium antarcticum TaxID=1798805 RepID=A0A657LPR5_9HYPH|nr:5'-nucleotidase C-terminal domain-containing protein [Pararhizobium antarcticum]OJF94512.1 multifunctional 2',3'-cyclic-nucleotide 2'-phosphodiesterase/5'-nucleotidase/3'-nucleotidase [Pararhizobium antarcticum]OJF96652.1 multifunctional 2',3'-cyclic-nucleotide 2'-phosphodiesterase/5'-nucleotidase/3'-nucleotidase [Rhizobium sp. 58]